MFNLSNSLSFRYVSGAFKWAYRTVKHVFQWVKQALTQARLAWEQLVEHGPFPGLQIKIAALTHQPTLEHWIARLLPDWLEHVLVLGTGLAVMGLAAWIAALDPIGAVIGVELIWPLVNIIITFGIAVCGIDLYKEDVWLRRKIQPWVCLAAVSVFAALSVIIPIPFMIGPAIAAAWWFPRRVHYLQVEDRLWQQNGVDFPLRYFPFGVMRRKRFARTPLGEDTLDWGGLPVRFKDAVLNFLIVGSIGSGKTIMLRLFLQTLLPHIHQGGTKRAIVYDAKQNFLPILKGINPQTPVHILNPFDCRHAAWDMSRDIHSVADCIMLADALAPEKPGDKNKFWRDVSFQIFTGLLTYYYLSVPAGQWTFRDVLNATQSPKLLKAILQSCEYTKHYADTLEQRGELGHNIIVTVQTYLAEHYVIAALWEQSTTKISLKQWINESSVLLLGNSHQHQVILSSINRLMLRLLKPIIADMDANLHPVADTYLIFDEVGRMGRIPDFEGFVATARDKGVSTALVFQELSDIQTVYGEKETNTLFGQFQYRAFFNLSSAATDRWASNLVGTATRPAIRRVRNMTVQPEYEWRNNDLYEDRYEDGSTYTRMETVRVLAPGKLAAIPKPKPREQGVCGYYLDEKGYWYTAPSWYISEHLKESDKTVQHFVPFNSNTTQLLERWTEADIQRLQLPFNAEQLQEFNIERERIMAQTQANTHPVMTKLIEKMNREMFGEDGTTSGATTTDTYGDIVDELVTTDSGVGDGFTAESSNEFPDLDPWA